MSLCIETAGLKQCNLTERVLDIVRKIFLDDNRNFSAIVEMFDSCRKEAPANTRNERDLESVLGHLVYIMNDGEAVFSGCSYDKNSWLDSSIRLERVIRDEHGFKKVTAIISEKAVGRDIYAFDQYNLTPSILIYSNNIGVKCMPHTSRTTSVERHLTDDEIVEFYRNKQVIHDGIQQARLRLSGTDRKTLQAEKDADLELTRQACQRVLGGAYTPPANRSTHPYRGPLLHILPRLLRPRAASQSPLALIAAGLPTIKSLGFDSILMGVTDRQSTSLYFGEFTDGSLVPYENNHGYWSSGEVGIDPLLGTADEYAALVSQARDLQLGFVQDSVFGTLGYPPQLERFKMSGLSSATTSVSMGNREADICDARLFLHELCIDEENSLVESVDPDHFATVVAHAHIGSPFALPKPNAFHSDVVEATLARTLWQIKQGAVAAFRIDMAKHMPIKQLRTTIERLRSAVVQSSGAAEPFSVLLEYWSVKYRDLQLATATLGNDQQGVYLFDFPLAHTLQEILVRGKSFSAGVETLLSERIKWHVPLCQLIPVFIDHDFNFRPIYNGSPQTRAIVIVGYALALMLSSNGPYVYSGFQDAAAGVPDIAQYHAYSEAHSRRVTSDLFCTDDPTSPAAPLAELFGVFQPVAANWFDDSIAFFGDHDSLTLSRTYIDKHSGRKKILRASFSRFHNDAPPNAGVTRLYEHRHGPSVVIEDDIPA